MCRLLALSAGKERVHATFWLLDAGDSLRHQSHRNPDGTGLGTFAPDGSPVVEKQPLAAYDDTGFAEEARDRESSTFLAHVRLATGTALTEANTHPFEMDGRLFAHNGAVQGLTDLERQLGEDLGRVHGDTDSERVFALITREIARAGDVATGIATALTWVAENLPVLALNIILTAPSEVWACRYPQTHELWLLERGPDRPPLREHSSLGTRVHADRLARHPSVVIASERLDDEPGWRLLEPGRLVHVDEDLRVTERLVLAEPPRHPLSVAEVEGADRS